MKLSNKGFSLVELMVVVAIIGILASVAVPSINKYMAKSRQSEAKTNLGSLYTAEKAFFAEYNGYHSGFQAIGYSPEGKLRYQIGFTGAGFQAGAAQGYTTPAPAAGWTFSTAAYCGAGGAMVNNCTVLVTPTGAAPAVPAGSVTGAAADVFIAGAGTILVNGAVADNWTINQQKILTNTQNGIP